MLNAYTLTQTFREIQFDIHLFLETLYEILNTTGEESTKLVESKWSNGSIDIIPSVAMVDTMVPDSYNSINIGNYTLTSTDAVSMDATGLYIEGDSADSGLCCIFENIGDLHQDITFSNSSIGSIDADIVTIDDSGENQLDLADDGFNSIFVKHTEIGPNSSDTDEATIDTLKASRLTVHSVDVSSQIVSFPIEYDYKIENTVGYSELLQYTITNTYVDGIRSVIILDGPTCMALPSSTRLRQFCENRFNNHPVAVVTVQVVGDPGVVKVLNTRSLESDGMDTFISPNSELGMLCLYPRVYGAYYSSMAYGGTILHDVHRYEYGNIDASDDMSIVQVVNTSNRTIMACNAWQFATGATANDDATVTALNFIQILPFSRIDFLLRCSESLSDHTRVVEMRPMKTLY